MWQVHCEQYSSNACEKIDGYPHTPPGHEKISSEILQCHLQCIDIQACFCQDAKSHIKINEFPWGEPVVNCGYVTLNKLALHDAVSTAV